LGIDLGVGSAREVWQRRGQNQKDPLSYVFLNLFFCKTSGSLPFSQGGERTETLHGKRGESNTHIRLKLD
jgi:hypothetical protein